MNYTWGMSVETKVRIHIREALSKLSYEITDRFPGLTVTEFATIAEQELALAKAQEEAK